MKKFLKKEEKIYVMKGIKKGKEEECEREGIMNVIN